MNKLRPGKYKVSELENRKLILVQDGNHGEYRPRSEEFCSSGVAFIRAADMNDGEVLFDSAEKINDNAFKRITKGVGKSGDILLSHKGTVGKLAKVPLSSPRFVCSPQTTFWRSLENEIIDREYLYYYMSSTLFRNQLDSRKGETDMAPYVSLTSQRDLDIFIPEIEKQKEISKILSPLDDKIKLNNQINMTIENMAKAIFKEWFIDFGPVLAKSEGKRPCCTDDETADLFPESMDKTELGLIPKGWNIATLESISDILNGFAFKSSDYKESGMLVLRTKNFSDDGFSSRLSDDVFLSEEQAKEYNSYLVQPFDIHLVMVAASIGKTSITPPCILPALRNQNMWCFRNKSDFMYRHFLNLLVPHVVEKLKGFSSGSARDFFRKSDFQAFKIIKPPREILAKFELLLEPMFQQIVNNIAENQELTKIRDLILPKLISDDVD